MPARKFLLSVKHDWGDDVHVAVCVFDRYMWVPFGESAVADLVGSVFVDATADRWPEGIYELVCAKDGSVSVSLLAHVAMLGTGGQIHRSVSSS